MRSNPIRDRRQEHELIRRRREDENERRRLADVELASIGRFDSQSVRTLTMVALRRLQVLIGQSRFGHVVGSDLVCVVYRTPGSTTMIDTPEGRLSLVDVALEVSHRG